MFDKYDAMIAYLKEKKRTIIGIIFCIILFFGLKTFNYYKDRNIKRDFTNKISKINKLYIKKQYEVLLEEIKHHSISKYNHDQYILLLNTKYTMLTQILKHLTNKKYHWLIEQGFWKKMKVILEKNNDQSHILTNILDELEEIYILVLNKNIYTCGPLFDSMNIHGEFLNLNIFFHSLSRNSSEKNNEFFNLNGLRASIFKEYIEFNIGILKSLTGDGNKYLYHVTQEFSRSSNVFFNKYGILKTSSRLSKIISIMLFLQSINKR